MTRPSARLMRVLTAAYRRLTLGGVPRLFDAAHYRAAHPEVARSGVDPFLHWVRRGAALGHDPSADFDTAFYRRQSGATRLDPLRHYLRIGAAAGLDPNPGFSTLMYLIRYPDVGYAGINPLLHYRQNGRAEGRIGAPAASDPDGWVALDGVPEARRWAYPAKGAPGFGLTLLRDAPVTAGPALDRLCLVLTLDGTEIAGLIHAVDSFAGGGLDALTLEFDTRIRPHPPRPTLILALEHCSSGPGPDGGIVLRYAEARIWNLLFAAPRMALIGPAGALAIRVG